MPAEAAETQWVGQESIEDGTIAAQPVARRPRGFEERTASRQDKPIELAGMLPYANDPMLCPNRTNGVPGTEQSASADRAFLL